MVSELELMHQEQAPIRVLHHWACSGGTIISRSIASLPKVLLLSEVHPLAYLRLKEPSTEYSPTDIIQQLSLQQNGRDPSLCISTWQGSILYLNSTLRHQNKILVLRSHSHIDFFCGGLTSRVPMISRSLTGYAPLIELLTVRHPLDTWLSILKNGWHNHFHTKELEVFCGRALKMLKGCEGMSWIRYEEFTLNPQEVLRLVAELFQLNEGKEHTQNLKNIKLSGDSGRSSDVIGMRPRQPIPSKELIAIRQALAAGNTSNYILLCNELGYEPDPNTEHPFLTINSPLKPNHIRP